ncbi:MAG: winged helix-turn-helix domain-containing protein [Nitrososphaerales archaeon]
MNRGYMEIIYSVLESSMQGALKTHIMFKCNLNSRQLQLYVQFLVDKGLLGRYRVMPSSKVGYKTTERGREYLQAYDTLLDLVGPAHPVRMPLRA